MYSDGCKGSTLQIHFLRGIKTQPNGGVHHQLASSSKDVTNVLFAKNILGDIEVYVICISTIQSIFRCKHLSQITDTFMSPTKTLYFISYNCFSYYEQ